MSAAAMPPLEPWDLNQSPDPAGPVSSPAFSSWDCNYCERGDRHDQDEHDAQIEQERIRIFGRDDDRSEA